MHNCAEDTKVSSISGGAIYSRLRKGVRQCMISKGCISPKTNISLGNMHVSKCLELLHPAAAFISAYLNFLILIGHYWLLYYGAST